MSEGAPVLHPGRRGGAGIRFGFKGLDFWTVTDPVAALAWVDASSARNGFLKFWTESWHPFFFFEISMAPAACRFLIASTDMGNVGLV